VTKDRFTGERNTTLYFVKIFNKREGELFPNKEDFSEWIIRLHAPLPSLRKADKGAGKTIMGRKNQKICDGMTKKAGGTEVPPALHSQVRFRLLQRQAGKLVLNMALVTQ
jgi:hypothetical protein